MITYFSLNTVITNRTADSILVSAYNSAVEAYNKVVDLYNSVEVRNQIRGHVRPIAHAYVYHTKKELVEEINHLVASCNSLYNNYLYNRDLAERLENGGKALKENFEDQLRELRTLEGSANVLAEANISREIKTFMGEEWSARYVNINRGYDNRTNFEVVYLDGKEFASFDVEVTNGEFKFNVGTTGSFEIGSRAYQRYMGMCKFMSCAQLMEDIKTIVEDARQTCVSLNHQADILKRSLMEFRPR